MEENTMTQKLGTTFILLIFMLLAFALLSTFSSYFETLSNQSANLQALQGGFGF
jgi:hypothetical protein